MKFIVTEIQTFANGTVSTINTVKDDRNEADSTYYAILAAAAISSLPCHGAILYTNEGGYIMAHSYQRAVNPNNTPVEEA